MDNTEVLTTHDKQTRNRMYDDLRKNGNELEQQAVRFSGYEIIPDSSGGQKSKTAYRSTYSIAYPRS